MIRCLWKSYIQKLVHVIYMYHILCPMNLRNKSNIFKSLTRLFHYFVYSIKSSQYVHTYHLGSLVCIRLYSKQGVVHFLCFCGWELFMSWGSATPHENLSLKSKQYWRLHEHWSASMQRPLETTLSAGHWQPIQKQKQCWIF